jgi:integrase
VDLNTGRIRVEQQLIPGRVRTIGTTKNGESRTVMLGASGLAASNTYSKRHRAFGQNNPFFVNERGEQLTKNAIYKKWYVIREQAGLPHARIHDLRHASLTELAQVGGTMAEVMAFGGHKDHRSAQRYQHASDERMEALVALRKEAV